MRSRGRRSRRCRLWGTAGPARPKASAVLVSLSQNNGSGGLPSGPAPAGEDRAARTLAIERPSFAVLGHGRLRLSDGRAATPKSQLQRLRNQIVGRTSSGAGIRAGVFVLRFATGCLRARALAHVTVTTK